MLSRLMTRKEQIVLLACAAAVIMGSGTMLVLRTRGDEAASTHGPPARPSPDVAVVPGDAAPAPNTTPEPIPERLESAAPDPMAKPAKIQVAVAGAIVDAGLYELNSTQRVQDLIDAAGGTTELADLSDINLAAPLIDATTLTIPSRPVVEDTRRRGDPVSIRAPAFVPVWNPPQYTISGWRATPAQAPAPSTPASPKSSTPVTHPPATGLIDLNLADSAALETLPGIGPKTAAAIIEYRQGTPFETVDELVNVRGIGDKKLEAVRHLVTVGPVR